MRYSVEDIYNYSGQYDRTVTISFTPNSVPYEKYGSYVVGTLYYTPKEREYLQNTINQDDYPQNDGIVKIDISHSDNLSRELQDELKHKGVKASDIIEILQFNSPVENEYSKSELRRLPDPIEVKVDLSDTDEEEMFLWLNNSRLKNGYKLIPSEINRHNGIILRKYEDRMPPEDLKNFLDKETGEIKDEIRYEYLKSKFFKDLLNEDEKKEFEQKTGQIGKKRAEILSNELQRSSERFKEVGINYKEGLTLLMYLSTRFEDERLNAGKFPVWWDFERFLHIYMRHVGETQVGERFESKTVFQYKLKDVKKLVETVIKRIEDDIQEHFQERPDREFRRIGEMSVYYNGDYYAIQIAPDGRLMRFHKNN